LLVLRRIIAPKKDEAFGGSIQTPGGRDCEHPLPDSECNCRCCLHRRAAKTPEGAGQHFKFISNKRRITGGFGKIVFAALYKYVALGKARCALPKRSL
jgi:hypothetical protein